MSALISSQIQSHFVNKEKNGICLQQGIIISVEEVAELLHDTHSASSSCLASNNQDNNDSTGTQTLKGIMAGSPEKMPAVLDVIARYGTYEDIREMVSIANNNTCTTQTIFSGSLIQMIIVEGGPWASKHKVVCVHKLD